MLVNPAPRVTAVRSNPRPSSVTSTTNCVCSSRKLTAKIAADPACDYLVVFVPSEKSEGKSYFAVEPVTQMTDAFNRASEDRDTGTRVLAPGASFSCTMSISVSRNG